MTRRPFLAALSALGLGPTLASAQGPTPKVEKVVLSDAEWQRWLDLAWSDRELRAQAANELERKLGEAVATITRLRDQLGRDRDRGALVGDVLRACERWLTTSMGGVEVADGTRR